MRSVRVVHLVVITGGLYANNMRARIQATNSNILKWRRLTPFLNACTNSETTDSVQVGTTQNTAWCKRGDLDTLVVQARSLGHH